VLGADALTWTPAAGDAADLIFCDPPFAEIPRIDEALFRRLGGFIRRDPPGLLVFEMPGRFELASPGWRFVKRIGHGRDQPTACFFVPE
jgi:hypothetical protein